MTGSGAALVRADALRLPLADESVDLIVTSPPYFGLRSYTDAGEHYAGQVGSEPGPAEFLAALWAATAEMKRVLKPGGSIFVNLGDKYAGSNGQPGGVESSGLAKQRGGSNPQITATRQKRPAATGAPPKSLLMLPERYRIGCVDQLGLIARAVIVWDKPNGLPESVRDRVRRSHEDWVHLTKSGRYYSAVDEIRESYSENTHARRKDGAGTGWATDLAGMGSRRDPGLGGQPNIDHPLGKLPGSVWTVPSEPLRLPEHLGVDHYAAQPSEWPRRLILGWSPPGVCVECGQGRAPVVDRELTVNRKGQQSQRVSSAVNGGATGQTLGWERETSILGYACACTPHTDHPGSGGTQRRDYQAMPGARPQGTYGRHQAGEYEPKGPWREYHLTGWTPPPTRPAVVLDPFCGTGTTVLVARALGRFGVGVDLSSDYLRAARWRIWDSGAASKAISRTNLERQGALL
jgi:DNA modification methylase